MFLSTQRGRAEEKKSIYLSHIKPDASLEISDMLSNMTSLTVLQAKNVRLSLQIGRVLGWKYISTFLNLKC